MNTDKEFQNTCGSTGALLSYFFISRCFSFAAFFIPVLLAVIGLRISGAYKKINLLKWFSLAGHAHALVLRDVCQVPYPDLR